jgi:hypothetical protein
VGNQVGTDDTIANSSAADPSKSLEKSVADELLALARKQNMNTDVRRSIFVALMSSEVSHFFFI